MDADIPQIAHITFYLAKKNITFENVLAPEAGLTAKAGLTTFDFTIDGATCRFFYFVSQTEKTNPPWLDFVNDKVTPPIVFKAKSRNPNGLLLISTAGRLFAAVFGRSAASYLEKTALEPDFGIKAAMNLCGNEEIRQTKTQNTAITTTQIDRQVSRPSESFVFGLSEAEDLKYISAHLKTDKNITLQGRDSLTMKLIGEEKLTWTKLIDQCRNFIKHYDSKDYVELFPNYRNFRTAVATEIVILDAALLAALKDRALEKLQLAIPDFLNEDKYSFSYTNYAKRENVVHGYLEIAQLSKYFDLDKITIGQLRGKRIYAYSHEDDRIIESAKWSVYECLIFEYSHNGKYFILADGRWVEVEREFYNSIVSFVAKKVREEPCEDRYRDIDIGDDREMKNKESIFNARVIELSPSSILFDQAKLKIGAGRSDKEFCDILDLQEDKIVRIIHCKPYGKSASLNHLFAQAKLYCEAFLKDPTFLEAIRDHIAKSPSVKRDDYLAHIKPSIEEIYGHDYRVCLWLLYDRKAPLPKKDDLTLMAKFELKLMHEHLRRVCKFRDIIIRFVPVQFKSYTRGV